VKKVPNQKHLLVKNEIVVNDKKIKSEEIVSQLVQQTNSSIFGYRLRLNMFNLAKTNTDSIFKAKYIKDPAKYKHQSKWLSKKQVDRLGQSFWYSGWHSFLRRTGEPPVIIDTLKAKKSLKRLNAYYKNNGFFGVKTNFKTNYLEKKRGEIKYSINTGKPTFLDTISKEIETPALDSLLLLSKSKSFLKQGKQYKVEDFRNEQVRISNYFLNHGVFRFQVQSVNFLVDTLTPNFKAPVKIIVSNIVSKNGDSLKSKPYKIFKINQVNIFTNDRFTKYKTQILDSATYKNFNIYSTTKLKYRSKAITDAIFIQKDSLYSDSNRTLTLRSLGNLQVFNFPNIEYVEDTITNTLKANIYLTSKDKFHFDANADFTRSNIQKFGITAGSGVSIRNVFNGAETFQVGLRGNVGSSKDFDIAGSSFFNISEIGADMRLNFPRIFLPFNTDKIISKSMFPSSIISAGFAKQTNIGLDKENFTAAINYNWIPRKNATAKFDLINIQYVKNINIGNYFSIYNSTYNQINNFAKKYNNNEIDLTKSDGGVDNFIADVLASRYPLLNSSSPDYKAIKSIKERKDRLTENNLIFAANYSYARDTKLDFFDKNFYSFRGKIESAGNILTLASKLANEPLNPDGTRNVFGLQYSQYIKTEFDFVKNWDLTNGKTFSVRSFFGIAIPYGNSKSIPFSRSYFAGGSNDNRAWQSYSLGPGSSGGLNDFNEANMKIALNAEFRYKLFGSLSSAFFADCGNIWNVFDNETDEKKVFKGFSSLQGLALGTGIGFRYDFKFFLFRLDFGFKTYNPSKNENEKWLKELNLAKAVPNIGINYPF
jgi:Omp85 superfamily domain